MPQMPIPSEMRNSAKFALRWLRSLSEDDTAQDMVEYSLLVVFIALAVVGLLTGIKTQIKGLWTIINNIGQYY
jgi:Flp pilus assembly pilin Flp